MSDTCNKSLEASGEKEFLGGVRSESTLADAYTDEKELDTQFRHPLVVLLPLPIIINKNRRNRTGHTVVLRTNIARGRRRLDLADYAVRGCARYHNKCRLCTRTAELQKRVRFRCRVLSLQEAGLSRYRNGN